MTSYRGEPPGRGADADGAVTSRLRSAARRLGRGGGGVGRRCDVTPAERRAAAGGGCGRGSGCGRGAGSGAGGAVTSRLRSAARRLGRGGGGRAAL
ncbi:hypothetical protein VULLAG_LOCUS6061 [Vulpes lagopus]